MAQPLFHSHTHTLRDEMETFRDIFENANIGIFQSTMEGRYVRANPALADMYGFDSVDAMLTSLTDISGQLYVEDGRREEFIDTLLNDGEVENFESEVRRHDGETIWISESARIVYADSGEIKYFEGFVKNVTQRVKLELQVADFTQTLENKVQRRTQELLLEIERRQLAQISLKEALRNAEAATEAKGKFLASMSHELRTPLNAIIGFAEAMKSEMLGPIQPPQYGEYVEIIGNSGHHLLALINDILDLSKIDAGAVELSRESVDIHDLLKECLDLIGHRAIEAQITINSEFDEAVDANIDADPRRLKQVFLNLLSNAIKFTPQGGAVSVQVERLDCRTMSISITDTGVGIATEDIPKVLSEYGQAEHGLDHLVEGTGLGLPITKKLVELHGGKLMIESVQGEGTTIRVRLPIEDVGNG